ncbi:MAG: diguanylate cyclase domain [Labilithrix sp.]|nr:diguanylate cyclase domain [Labilithrix sp.]
MKHDAWMEPVRAPAGLLVSEPTASERVWPLAIVVVEGELEARTSLVRSLVARGHTVRAASTLGAARLALAESRPDVVLCAWSLSDGSGLALCDLIRAADGEPYTYFILATRGEERERLFRAMEAGADDYQRKPVDLEELDARLVLASRVVALHRRLREQADVLARESRRFYVASHTDALTGVGNRLALEEGLRSAAARFTRYGRPVSLAMCDVDWFKRFNDTSGHLAGDEALRCIARAIRAELRDCDHVYRYGGEELVVVLPEQRLGEAVLAAERVRRAVERLRLATSTGEGSVTMSAGVAELTAGEDTTSWLARADDALYLAKRSGRNRVEPAPHDAHAVLQEPIGRGQRAADEGRTHSPEDVSAREELLTIVAHDLRGPLSTLLLATHDAGDLADAERRLTIARRAARRMSKLVEDLLDAARIEAGNLLLSLVPNRASAVLEELRAALAPIAEADGVELRISCVEDFELPCALDRLVQVLVNLGANAINFSRPGQEVRVTCTRTGSQACFTVEDDGPGIPRSHLGRVLHRGFRSNRGRRRGAGLGLAIARGLVEAHGGTLSVTSDIGQGATFRVSLDVAAPPSDGRWHLVPNDMAAEEEED